MIILNIFRDHSCRLKFSEEAGVHFWSYFVFLFQNEALVKNYVKMNLQVKQIVE